MKALTVQQPWAWAILRAGKDIENRTQAWSYRGPLAIHAGARWSEHGGDDLRIRQAFTGRDPGELDKRDFRFGAVIGVVDLVDVHQAMHLTECCESTWAEASYVDPDNGQRVRVTHLVLENPRPLTWPIPCPGRLGLWSLPPDVLEQVLTTDDLIARSPR